MRPSALAAAKAQHAGDRLSDVDDQEMSRPDKEPERRVEQPAKNSRLRLSPRLRIELKRRHGGTPRRETERAPSLSR